MAAAGPARLCPSQQMVFEVALSVCAAGSWDTRAGDT